MKYIFIVITLLMYTSVSGQQVPAKKVEYFTKTGEKLPSIDGAYCWQETVYQDSIQGTIRSFYANGKPRAYSDFENVGRAANRGNGISEGWYENGQLRMREKWLHGSREGELVTYYPNGKLKRRELFADGKSVSGECFNSQGELVPFFAYEIMPAYPGGSDAFMQFIATNIQYPAKALRNNIKGQVQVGFSVDSTGQMRNIRVVKSVHPLVDAEALRVVHQTLHWTPGQQDGRPVTVSFTVPINFNIEGPKLFKSKK